MVGGIHKDFLVAVALLFFTQTQTQCRAENEMLVTLPDWRTNSGYVTQCSYDRNTDSICDWTRRQEITEDITVDILESGPLGVEDEACLEFWYRAPAAANGSEHRALLKSSAGLVEIWTSPANPRNVWSQVFVPLNVTEPATQVVLEERSTDEQVTYRQIGVRRGFCGPQCESNTELWTDESTHCLCSAGHLSCSPSRCPEGHVCGPQRGGSSETSASGTCTIHAHTECSTFDGVLFRFMAPCTYVLAKTCSPAEGLPPFSVEVVYEQSGNSSVTTVQQVSVSTRAFRLSLLNEETHRVVVNGVWKKLPLNLRGGAVNIKGNPAAVLLGTDFGLSVSFDNAGAVHVTLPSSYADKVCGLCGNFNHFKGDDLRQHDGTVDRDGPTPAESGQTPQATSSCDTALVPHQCDPLQEAQYASESHCGALLSNNGPFAECQSVLAAKSYFRGCVLSMCTTHGDPAVLCETLQAYADICQKAGVNVTRWRNSTFCSLQCGVNSHYNPCADGCPEVCSSMDIVGSCGSCEERCECESGFKLSGGKCVPSEDCGCWYSEKYYEKGAAFVKGECVQQCLCMGNNDVQCTSMQCAHDEVCKVEDGERGCFAFTRATCSVYGDPHYITYDGMVYDFQGGCSYTLTTTCGGESSVQFTIIGHNVHPPLQNFTRSKLEAVTLQVEGLHLTLNQSGEVYLNSSSVQLPFTAQGTFGSVMISLKNNYIAMETTFGLQMVIDGKNRLFLQVDEHYKYELCGLCGTYSGYQGDDFVTPGGENASEAFEFANSWRVLDNKECTAYPNDPRACDIDQEDEAFNQCYALLGDAFRPCHELIHPSIYISSCVYDYCATNGEQNTLCESLKSYAAACQVAGVELPPWQAGTACVCPINCDFEKNLCGWQQLIQDSFDWTQRSGPTPSNLTGPNVDHTTGEGFYLYIEGNDATYGDPARLLSSVCNYNGPLCFHFWYHMYGSATAMALNIYLLKSNKATKVWSTVDNQGPEWHPGYVEISVSGPFEVILEGIRGSNDQSDVALDDISIHFGSCSDNFPGLISQTDRPFTTADVLPSYPVCGLDCSFDNNLCSWNQMITDAFDWTWQSGSTPTEMTGPLDDHTGGGHYLYIEASSVTHGDTARIISTECSDSGPQCLQFWYHMYGSADTMGLHVYLYQDRVATAVWRKRNDQGNMWHLAQVDITTTGAFQIIFEGRRGSTDLSDVAIDDIRLYRGVCSDLISDFTTQPHQNATTAESVSAPSTVTPQTPVINATTRPPVEATTITENDTSTSLQTQEPDQNSTSTEGVSVPSTATPETPVITVTPQTPVINATRLPHVEATTNINNDWTTSLYSVCTMDCDFEQDLCEWSQTPTDAFDWTRQRGSTPTTMTGPSSDHTTGSGHYLYIEASSVTHGDTARIISTECSDSGPQCLQFWYHMYGSADTMGLHVYLYQDRVANAVWRKRNDQGNMWHLAQVDITTTGAFQVIFEGRRGSTDLSDVAIDDIRLYRGVCSDLISDFTTQPHQNATTAESVSATSTVTPQTPGINATTPPPVEATTNTENDTSTPLQTAQTPKPGQNITATQLDVAANMGNNSSLLLHTAPSCPENSHYATCIPVCSATCAHLNGPPGCSNSDTCTPGCVCDNGFVQKSQVCVPVEQCGCVDSSGSTHRFSEVWYTNRCSQKCECEKDDGVGKVDCADKDKCDGSAVCLQDHKWDFYCQATDFSECSIKENHKYKTFDKVKHGFRGELSYVLVQTKNLPHNVPHVYIEVSFTRSAEDDDDSQRRGGSSSEEDHSLKESESEEREGEHELRQLKIRVYNHTVAFQNNWRLVVDGKITNTPVSPTSGLNIQRHSSHFYLKTDFGLSVEFDGHSSATIVLSHIYKRKVGGLCGNFDGHQWNDQMKPDGTRASGVQEFGQSWQV
ncbi:zonadhesin isoform X2 [Betta splendens]|uniref:Zonadhesin isoform X2 n=1 Tax=Betta splendens TaxID=158456 RepID=A0A6P7KYY4_BETSP|nr:zonadhesin isoform X2 [Betta splendens]